LIQSAVYKQVRKLRTVFSREISGQLVDEVVVPCLVELEE